MIQDARHYARDGPARTAINLSRRGRGNQPWTWPRTRGTGPARNVRVHALSRGPQQTDIERPRRPARQDAP